MHRHSDIYTAVDLQSSVSDLYPRDATMAPRYALPSASPGHGEVSDYGQVLNWSAAATPFSHGLGGVDQDMNWLLSNIMVITFCGLLAVVLVHRWLHRGKSYLRKIMSLGRESDRRYWMHEHNQLWPRVKKHLLYAPLGHTRHNREFQISNAIGIGTLPSRFHTILLVLYLLSNIAYCCILDYGHESEYSVIAELRGRTGQLAALNLIPTVLFALRNNPLIRFTGVSYDTFNLLHRWCARILILEAVVHTISWAVNTHRAAGSAQIALTLATSTSYQWGMVATCTFSCIFLITPSPFRHAFYETFLNTHRILVILALGGVYVHLDKANLPQLPYVKLAFALWGTEWLWRSLRICYLNVSRRRGLTKVHIEALPGEACRVTFDLRRPWTYTPGCHVHVYIPVMSLWSSHPFSIAWAENRPKSPPLEIEMEKLPSHNPSEIMSISKRPSLVTRQSTYSTKTGKTLSILGTVKETGANKQTHQLPNTSIPREATVTSISLIMRARSGLTRQIYEHASKLPGGTFSTWGAIEGPYGGHESFTSYGTVILFAGGVGITHCVGYAHHLLTQYAAGTCATKKILLVWSVPNTECLEWVRVWMDQILRMEHRREVLRIQLFVTKPRHRGEVMSNTGSVQMFPGRCNPTTILEKEMPERIGAVGVTVCGPGAFADSVRSAVRGVMDQGAIDFVEEAFTY
nr:hypothetical protein B0A51_05116 [Rachicladosporium sp. CCFEE 5018]